MVVGGYVAFRIGFFIILQNLLSKNYALQLLRRLQTLDNVFINFVNRNFVALAANFNLSDCVLLLFY